MQLSETLKLQKARLEMGIIPSHQTTVAGIDALIEKLPLSNRKPNDPETVTKRRKEVKAQYLLIASALPSYDGRRPDSLANKIEQLAFNFLHQHDINVRFNAEDLHRTLEGMTDLQRDVVECAGLRFPRKIANHAMDYTPEGVEGTVKAMYDFFMPVPAQQLRSTDERHRYPLGEKTKLWRDIYTYVGPLPFSELTLIDQFSAVNREAREVEKLVTGRPRNEGTFFRLMVQEVAPLGIAAWQAFQSQHENGQKSQFTAKEDALYSAALADLFARISSEIVEYARTGQFSDNDIVSAASEIFSPERLSLKQPKQRTR